MLVHPGHALEPQGLLGQHIGRVGAGVQFIVQAQRNGVLARDLLSVAQDRSGLHIAEAVAVVAVDLEGFTVFAEFGHVL